MAVIKEFNLRRYYETKYYDKTERPKYRAKETESRRVKEEPGLSTDVFHQSKITM